MNNTEKRPYEILEKYVTMSADEFVSYDVGKDCIDQNTGSDYKADVSIEAMTIAESAYSPTFRDFFDNGTWNLVPQKTMTVNGQNGQKIVLNKEKLKYEFVYRKVVEKDYSLRGDTMNTATITNAEYRKLNNTEELPDEAYVLMNLYHTAGNFFLVPYKNGHSLTLSRRETGPSRGYFDLFLLAVYNFFSGKTDYTGSLASVLKDEGLADFYKRYLTERFVTNNVLSWDKYIEINYLQDYVEGSKENGYGRPIELWPGHFTGKVMPQTEEEFILFYNNAADRTRKRGKRIYLVLKKKMTSIAKM